MKLLMYAMVALLISGCATTPDVITKTEYQKEYVKVYQCPAPDVPEQPYLPVYDITKSSTPDDIATAYGKSVDLLINENTQLRTQLANYGKLNTK